MKRYQIEVFGKVQGVFFRANTQKTAIKFDLVGFVRNRPNGSVYIEAEGKEDDIKGLIKWCHQGSAQANVTNVEESEVNVLGVEKEFAIRR